MKKTKRTSMTKTITTKKMTADDRDYYCSMKFRFLKIDVESRTSYNCHAAKPHEIDFKRLSDNPGQLFNTTVNVFERQQMLSNQRNESCEQNCWKAEDAGAVSPRLYQGGQHKTHSQCHTTPEILEITMNSDCNLTCSYCCKEYSSAWRRDIANNGSYDIPGYSSRFSLDAKDRALYKISQNELKSTARHQQLSREIALFAPGLQKLVVTGGEPLLDNNLIDFLSTLELGDHCQIQIYTGLGVSASRLTKFLSRLQTFKNLYLTVSAEGTEKFYEFNRYGNSWSVFLNNVQLLSQQKIKYNFQSTLSNLTLFGFADFVNCFKQYDVDITFAYQPDWMSPYVLDPHSKEIVSQQIEYFPDGMKNQIIQSMLAEPTSTQKQNMQVFLREFVKRRPNIDVAIYPKTFLNWINYVV